VFVIEKGRSGVRVRARGYVRSVATARHPSQSTRQPAVTVGERTDDARPRMRRAWPILTRGGEGVVE